jgi:hypothetical protein
VKEEGGRRSGKSKGKNKPKPKTEEEPEGNKREQQKTLWAIGNRSQATGRQPKPKPSIQRKGGSRGPQRKSKNTKIES